MCRKQDWRLAGKIVDRCQNPTDQHRLRYQHEVDICASQQARQLIGAAQVGEPRRRQGCHHADLLIVGYTDHRHLRQAGLGNGRHRPIPIRQEEIGSAPALIGQGSPRRQYLEAMDELDRVERHGQDIVEACRGREGECSGVVLPAQGEPGAARPDGRAGIAAQLDDFHLACRVIDCVGLAYRAADEAPAFQTAPNFGETVAL